MREIHNERCIDISDKRGMVPAWHSGENTFYFGSGREALISLIGAMQLRPGSVILLPAMVPEGIFAPFKHFELNVQFYPLDIDLDPKWEALSEVLDKWNPRVAVMIHYFGLRKPIERFSDECRRRGAIVVEDLAHVVRRKDSDYGKYGDVVLYSFPKVFGVPDGAALVLNAAGLKGIKLEYEFDSRHVRYVFQQCALLAGNTASLWLPEKWGHRLRSVLSRLFNSYRTLMDYYYHPNPMSGVSRWLLGRTDIEGQANIRSSHARLYHERLNSDVFCRFKNDGFHGHPSIGFPVQIKMRGRFAAYMRSKGISGIYFFDCWDFIPPEECARFTEAKTVLEQNFLFPTAPHLTTEEVLHVIVLANAWATENS